MIRIMQFPPHILSLISPNCRVISINAVEITQDEQQQRVNLILHEPEHLTLVIKGDGSSHLEYNGEVSIRPVQ